LLVELLAGTSQGNHFGGSLHIATQAEARYDFIQALRCLGQSMCTDTHGRNVPAQRQRCLAHLGHRSPLIIATAPHCTFPVEKAEANQALVVKWVFAQTNAACDVIDSAMYGRPLLSPMIIVL
jgi:hypothetical protein